MDDFTFYPSEAVVEKLAHPSKTSPLLSKDVMFSFAGDADKEKLQRGLLCRCYAKHNWALTARETDRLAKDIGGEYPQIEKPEMSRHRKCSALTQWPADPNTVEEQRNRTENGNIVLKMWNMAGKMGRWSDVPPGLIVIAGETGSRKTSFAKEIARRHIALRLDRGERPHVITYEDPIESWFAESPNQASKAGFEYTPRQKHLDVEDLEIAVREALRQKPALLYVSEVRTEPDWRSLLDFAGTGHLAITTTHAGSLIETFSRIFKAANATTSANRSEIAGRIVAVAHIKKFSSQLVPSLWVQTPHSRMALTQGGLGALLPSTKGGYFGRADFARTLQLDGVFVDAVQADLRGE